MLRHSEDETLLDRIESAADALRSHLRSGLDGAGIPLAPLEARALLYLQAHPGCSQADFVHAAGRDKGQVARLVKLLGERGLLVNLPDRDDRRIGRLWLTDAGQALGTQVRAARLEGGRELLAGLDARERARLATLLGKFGGSTPPGAASDDMPGAAD